MRRSLRGGGGTETARPLDIGRFGRAISQPGIDPRHWVSYGTVCTINADGTPNYADQQAVFVDADGCMVDVLLSPTMQHVTARYSGVQGGSTGTIYTPIRAGDEVLVEIPEGDLSFPPVITRILSAEHSRLPMNPDRTPIWQNDRVLVHGNGVKVQLVASGGGQVNVKTDGTVTLGADTATEQIIKGTSYRSAESSLNSEEPLIGLQGIWTAAAAACVGPLTPLKPFFTAAAQAIKTFEARAGSVLSDVAKTE